MFFHWFDFKVIYSIDAWQRKFCKSILKKLFVRLDDVAFGYPYGLMQSLFKKPETLVVFNLKWSNWYAIHLVGQLICVLTGCHKKITSDFDMFL